MPETKVVQVTGRGSNVNLAIDDAVSFQEVLTGLRAYLGGNSSLYSQGVITVNVGRRMLEKEQLTEIKELLERESGVTVSSFWCPPDVLQEALSESVGFGVEVAPGDAYRSSVPPPPAKREIMHNDPAWLTGDQPSTANDLRRFRELGEYLFQSGAAPAAEISFREPDPAADLGVPAPRNGEPDASENGVASKAEALSPQQPALPGLAVSSRPGPEQETEKPSLPPGGGNESVSPRLGPGQRSPSHQDQLPLRDGHQLPRGHSCNGRRQPRGGDNRRRRHPGVWPLARIRPRRSGGRPAGHHRCDSLGSPSAANRPLYGHRTCGATTVKIQAKRSQNRLRKTAIGLRRPLHRQVRWIRRRNSI